jgi:acyl-CoA synthetase (AMP-forming)/AMP-acid ligase II/acyl carrier protein
MESPALETLSGIVQSSAERAPDAPAIRGIGGEALTYRALEAQTEEQAAVLAGMALQPGDHVAIVSPNGPELASAFLAVSRAATAAPLNENFRQPEFEYYLNDLQARAVVLSESSIPGVEAAAAAAGALGIPVVWLRAAGSRTSGSIRLETGSGRDAGQSLDHTHFDVVARASQPSDVALVLHTSGTTSRPKIVPLTHANLCRSAANVAATLRLAESDLCLNVMPLFHIHGLVAALLATLRAGASVACTPGFRAAEFLGWMDALSPTWYTAVPTMHQGILQQVELSRWTSRPDRRLRLIRSSSASLAPSVLQRLESVFEVPVVEAYGMTEAAHQMTCNPLPPAARKPGSVGPAEGPEVAIADEGGRVLPTGEVGEVIIRGPNVTAGYLQADRNGEAFHEGGWFRTGDQGYLDGDGYLYLTGRLKEMINRGGESLSPREIDEVLLAHPGVRQAVAFAIPDDRLGEEVGAAVILTSAEAATEQELFAFMERRLSMSKIPKRLVFLDEIPKGPTGKLQRIGLAEKLGVSGVRVRSSGDEQPTGASADRAEEAGTTTEAASIGEAIAGYWAELLGREARRDEPFLDAGGDSVSAAALVYRVEEHYGIEIPLVRFFHAETIEQQAALIRELLESRTSPTR